MKINKFVIPYCSMTGGIFYVALRSKDKLGGIGMKGPTPAEIPAHFTLAWYCEQKEIKKTDVDIAEELFISLPLLSKWKKKIGWETEKIYKQMCGRKPILDVNQIIELKNRGLKIKEIANALDVTTAAIHYHLKKIS